MDTVVLVLMLLTAFNFLLKQTFWKLIAVGIIAAICAVFGRIDMAVCYRAIEDSDSQLAKQSALDARYFRTPQCGSLHTNGLCHACRPRSQ